MCYQACVGFVV
jgi:hypothetical protein